MSDPKSHELLDQFLAGKGEAAAAIFDRYVERLLALARTRISAKLRRRVDPEDVVQSAYRSFFLHAQNREYQLDRSGDLWRLLASTTLNKLHGQIEKQTAAKRSINREAAEDVALAELAAREPTIADLIAVAEQLTLIMNGLSADERFVLTSTIHGQDPGEIAKAIGKSERTVRRLVAQARSEFERQLLDGRAQQNHRRAPRSRVSFEPLDPLRFEDYRLEKLLGSGGMGKVYRATDKRSGQTVAIKSLHKARQHDDRAVARFVQESQILGKLRHSSIVGVEGLGRFPAGGYFIVMDFIDGTDLQTRLKSGPLPETEAVSIISDVASAVQHAHDHGIIHCDLKPANVLIGNGDRVFVTDFGFACILTDMSSASAQAIGGTAGYIAPEVLRHESEPTPAADIFALGAMLWTLVTGHVPLSLDEVRAEQHDAKPIEAICRRCLARKPADRFPAVTDVIDALRTRGL
jgi:RNA polymerase sigma factor (sigma-70 family)